MKIVIAGGKTKADFLIRSLLGKKHQLIVINDDADYCAYLARIHNIQVIHGDPCKGYVLEDAEIEGADIILALKPSDADNLAICQTAKRLFQVKRTVAIVSNPKCVDIFKRLGVNTAISATYMVANYIEQASAIDNLVNTLSVENQIVLTELMINDSSLVCNKKIMDINFDEDIIISCILRGTDMIVPKGKTVILPNDKLIILSTSQMQPKVIDSIMGEI